jgi:DNA-binding NarL/FixJ family response regulator
MNPQPRSASPGRPARLLIVDDHELARAGLKFMFERQVGLEVVGEAANGHDAVAICARLRPDLVLMDVRMPEMDGLAATRAVREECPGTSVIIVTMHESPEYLAEALRAGAAGFVLKDASNREIVAAVRAVLRGESLLNPALMTRLLRRLVADANVRPRVGSLTVRELEVLELLVQGHTNKEIARRLVIGPGTVKSHVERIISKLGAADRTQAAVQAVRQGLVPAQEWRPTLS